MAVGGSEGRDRSLIVAGRTFLSRSRTLHAKFLSLSRLLILFAVVMISSPAAQQRPQLSSAVRAYVVTDAPVIALTHVRVIDGTGVFPREDQTVVIRDGNIAAIGNFATTAVPEGAHTIDLTGKSVIPGLVMVHEHLYYPNGPGVHGQLGESFSRDRKSVV